MLFSINPSILLAILVTLDRATTEEVALGVNTCTEENAKTMPIKTSSYTELISRGIFVDKSLLIDAIIRTPIAVSMITCPKKWGKTVNLDMLKEFLQIQVHPNGTRILPISDTPNYRLFTEGKYYSDSLNITLQKPLLISNEKYKYLSKQYLGQYPVIYLSFAEMSTTFESNYVNVIGKIIANTFEQHYYMVEVYDGIIRDQNMTKNKKKLRSVENKRKEFVAYLNQETTDEDQLHKSIHFLSEELHNHFEKQVFILVDDFDKSFLAGGLELIKNILFFALNKNDYLEQSIITGVLALGWKANIAVFFPFLDSRYNLFYGFTKNEMNLIYRHYQVSTDEQNKIEHWYGGYEIPRNDLESVFNPSSVSNYMNYRHFEPYWMDANSEDLYLNEIFGVPEFLDLFCRLVVGEEYDISIPNHSLRLLKETDLNFSNAEESAKRTFTKYLIAAGYLTLKNKNPVDAGTTKTNDPRAGIPNHEVSINLQQVFATKLNEVLETHLLKLLKQTSNLWEHYLLGKHPVPYELENRLQQCFRSLAIYCKKKLHNVPNDREGLVTYVVMSIITSSEFQFVSLRYTKILEENDITLQRDIVLSSKSRGFIINVKHEENENSTANRLHEYYRILDKYMILHDWEDTKIIGCTVMPNREVKITSITYPDTYNKRNRVSLRKPFHIDGSAKSVNSSELKKKQMLKRYLTELGLE